MDDTEPLTEPPVIDLLVPRSPAEAIVWRELRPGLWAGRANGKPVGIIEHGHRYSFTGIDDRIHPGYRTLADAQDAATGPIQVTAPRTDETGETDVQSLQSPNTVRHRSASTLALIPAVAAAGGLVAGGIALATQFFLN